MSVYRTGPIVVGYDVEHDRDETMATELIRELVKAYPGHAWFVTIKGGVVVIKDMELNDKWGMCLHYSELKADAAARKQDVLRAAGEFLERANLKRGSNTGEKVKAIEGVPDKDMVRQTR